MSWAHSTTQPAQVGPGIKYAAPASMCCSDRTWLSAPVLARDCQGDLVVRARLDREGLGGCTWAADSATGIVCHSVQTDTEYRHLYITGFHPG